MSKLKLLILDAGIVIHLHECGIWQQLIAKCDVHLARTVAEDESVFFEVDEDKKHIDLSEDIAQSRIHVFEVPLADINRFRAQFDPYYLGELDPGETESLAYLTQAKEKYLISSGDAIVYRVLAQLRREDQGISLEEILQAVGLQRSELPWSCRKQFREKHTQEGAVDGIQGRGLKQPKK